MSFKKRLLKHRRTQAILAFLLAAYIRLVYVTSRKTFHYDEAAMPYMRGEHNAIFAFWHGRMMLCPTICPPGRQMRVLSSHHGDGRLISTVIGYFNQETISGSSSRGGKAALLEMLRCLGAGDNISITPDGPRGPVQQVAKGIVTAAKHAKKPVLPVTFSSTHHKRMRSWDRFMLALPLGRIVFCVGAPIMVDANADKPAEEAARHAIEQAMNQLVEKADALAV
jgi:lysophospholipid acyltransferase (LPLAT)-like uncharacterized protein